jgi:hypothetical protein
MDQVWYATREDVRSALSSASAARSDAQIDRAIETGSRAVDDLCQRDFAPVLATRYFDWPNAQRARTWRFWLDRDEVISVTQVTSGGTVIPPTDYYLEPNRSGPPYNRIETRLDRPSAWIAGQTHQRSIGIFGLFGFQDTAAPAGALAAAITSTTQTSMTVTQPAAVGVGALIRCGDERMIVTDKTSAATGQTIQTPLAAQKNDVLVQAQDGTAFAKGDVITLGAERMLVRDIAANTLTVDRAYDGTILDSHSGTAIWAPTVLTVTRAAAGTTAAPAASGTALTRWVPPAQARTLAIAEAMCTLLNEQSGYARTVRSQAGTSGTRSVAAVTVERDTLRQEVAESRLARKVRARGV